MARRKNTKRIDPRYFLEETVDDSVNEERADPEIVDRESKGRKYLDDAPKRAAAAATEAPAVKRSYGSTKDPNWEKDPIDEMYSQIQQMVMEEIDSITEGSPWASTFTTPAGGAVSTDNPELEDWYKKRAKQRAAAQLQQGTKQAVKTGTKQVAKTGLKQAAKKALTTAAVGAGGAVAAPVIAGIGAYDTAADIAAATGVVPTKSSGEGYGVADLALALGKRPEMTGGTQLGPGSKQPGAKKKQIRPGEEGFVPGEITYRNESLTRSRLQQIIMEEMVTMMNEDRLSDLQAQREEEALANLAAGGPGASQPAANAFDAFEAEFRSAQARVAAQQAGKKTYFDSSGVLRAAHSGRELGGIRLDPEQLAAYQARAAAQRASSPSGAPRGPHAGEDVLPRSISDEAEYLADLEHRGKEKRAQQNLLRPGTEELDDPESWQPPLPGLPDEGAEDPWIDYDDE